MKLYASPLSPFSARVRFSLYFKNIPFEQVKPSSLGGMRSPGFLAVTPLGKIPVLETDSGWRLPESDVIVEYLEDAVPNPSLRPEGPESIAAARLLSRLSDLYLLMRLLHGGLTSMMPVASNRKPDPPDETVVQREWEEVSKALDHIEHFMANRGPFALGENPSTADGALIPYLVFVDNAARFFGRSEWPGSRPRLSNYLDAVSAAEPAAARVRGEVEQALIDRRGEIEALVAKG